MAAAAIPIGRIVRIVDRQVDGRLNHLPLAERAYVVEHNPTQPEMPHVVVALHVRPSILARYADIRSKTFIVFGADPSTGSAIHSEFTSLQLDRDDVIMVDNDDDDDAGAGRLKAVMPFAYVHSAYLPRALTNATEACLASQAQFGACVATFRGNLQATVDTLQTAVAAMHRLTTLHHAQSRATKEALLATYNKRQRRT